MIVHQHSLFTLDFQQLQFDFKILLDWQNTHQTNPRCSMTLQCSHGYASTGRSAITGFKMLISELRNIACIKRVKLVIMQFQLGTREHIY